MDTEIKSHLGPLPPVVRARRVCVIEYLPHTPINDPARFRHYGTGLCERVGQANDPGRGRREPSPGASPRTGFLSELTDAILSHSIDPGTLDVFLLAVLTMMTRDCL